MASAMNCYMLFPAIQYPPAAIKSTQGTLKGEAVCPPKAELKIA